ncbi:MAG: glycosyltransferase family 2 protein [Hyphomicrobium sp.]
MDLQSITPVILTYNEEANLERCLDNLAWAKRIVVVDSFSTDKTPQIAASVPQVELMRRAFTSHADQWNFATSETRIETDWILALDADYMIGEDWLSEIRRLSPSPETFGFRAAFNYCVFGKRLRASLYPPVTVLYRQGKAGYVQAGHTQRLIENGKVEDLACKIDHDDRKPLAHWFASQQRYAGLEADYLLSLQTSKLRTSDRIRRMGWPAPVVVPIYALLAQRAILDGWPGLYYVLQRAVAESMIALEIADRRLRRRMS